MGPPGRAKIGLCGPNTRGAAWISGEIHFPSTYLGLPVYVGRSKKLAFGYIKDKIWNKLQDWKGRLMSKAAQELLVKVGAQDMPTFAMPCFYLTKGFCDEISTMTTKYWWSQQENENKIHWLGWKKLTKPKGKGGLGFRVDTLFLPHEIIRCCGAF